MNTSDMLLILISLQLQVKCNCHNKGGSQLKINKYYTIIGDVIEFS